MKAKGSGGLFNGHEVSVWEGEEVLEVESGTGCATRRVYIMPLNCPLKMVKMVTFMHIHYSKSMPTFVGNFLYEQMSSFLWDKRPGI